MKHGLHTDGRTCGPIDPKKVNEDGWTWYDTEAERDAAVPIDWYGAVDSRADAELNKGITVTKDGVDYRVATTPDARSLIVGGKIAAQEAIDAGVSITEPIPTDKGIVDANENEMVALFNLVKDRRKAIVERVRTLHGKVADGTITEADLEVWP